ncbi:MAG: hypothetical protein ROY82_05860 [Truepera sp.]|nr:hypothetical protein [Truepera sp.]
MTASLVKASEGRPRRFLAKLSRLPLAALLVGLCLAQAARAADASATFTLGVANQVVAGAWNHLRVETRDLPPSTLTLALDVGTLREGEIPVNITHELRGGGGVFTYETDLFVPPFRSLAWRVATADRVLASGSLSSRESDPRELVLGLADPRAPAAAGELRAAVPGARFVSVRPSDLPVTPAGYDGVSALLVDHAAPPLDALVAAAVAGARVVFVGGAVDLSPSLETLLGDATASRLGAGTLSLTRGDDRMPPQAADLAALRPRELLLAALAEPLVVYPKSVSVGSVLIASATYALLVLVLLRFGGGPGLISALLVAVLVGLGGWRALRPPVPPYESSVAVGVIGGQLALLHEARESVTLPPVVLDFEAGAAPARPQAYFADDGGVHVPTAAWRSVTMLLPPRAVSAPIHIDGLTIGNASRLPLTNLYVTGLGAQSDLAPGGTVRLEEGELGAFPARYDSLVPLLPDGTLVAQSGCEDEGACVLWLADTGATAGSNPAAAGGAIPVASGRHAPPAARGPMPVAGLAEAAR